MADDKSILEKLEDEAKDITKKVEEVLDEISADENPPKFTYSDEDKTPETPKQ